MQFPLKTLALSVLSVLALGGAAKAADISISIHAPGAGFRQVADWDGGGYYGGGRREVERYVEERRGGRGYGYGHGYDDDGYRSWPERRSWSRPVSVRPAWGHEECRVIIKRRVNPWGDVVVKRIKICD